MIGRIAVSFAVLALLGLLGGWLKLPEPPPGDQHDPRAWVLGAYAVVLTALAGYRSWLADRERRALGARRGGPRRAVLAGTLEQLGLSSLGIGLVLALLYAPEDLKMGMYQRIFYVHVPCAWVAGLAYTVVFAASIAYLAKRSAAADRLAFAAAEVGVVFTTLVLVSGPIWARPVWGIWWTWDARLTTTLVLWLVYIGYLMLRGYVPDADRRARLAAVVGILGFVGVVIDYMAIRWWRTQHPQPVIGGGEGSGLDPLMARAFVVMLVAMTLVFLALLAQRLEVGRLEAKGEE